VLNTNQSINQSIHKIIWLYSFRLGKIHLNIIAERFHHDLIVLFSEKVAIKIIDKTKLDQKTQRLLSREITSMERLHHPNIIRLYEVVETLAKMHIVMEYAGGGELFNKISNDGKFTELEAKSIMAQVVAGVSHMVGDLIYHFVTGVTTW
jgi:serine/threonine protein kinase